MNKDTFGLFSTIIILCGGLFLLNTISSNYETINFFEPFGIAFALGLINILRYIFGFLIFIMLPVTIYIMLFTPNKNRFENKKIEASSTKQQSLELKDNSLFEVLISIRILINDENFSTKKSFYDNFMRTSDEILKVPRVPENIEFFEIEAYHEFNTLKSVLKTISDGISITDDTVSHALTLVTTGLEKHIESYRVWKLGDLSEESMILETVINKEKV